MPEISFAFPRAERMGDARPYFFASLAARQKALRQKGMRIIALDIGSPDMPPADFIIETLADEAARTDTHGYAQHGGSSAFRSALAQYYLQRFQVSLDPTREVLGLIGSKEGVFNLNQVLLNPSELVLVGDPGYPVYSSAARICGGTPYPMPLTPSNDYLPDLEAIPPAVCQQAKIMWLNYPNNPTGASASLAFFEKAVWFAKKHHILIAHDAPYTDVCFDGFRAPSILQVDGAKEVAVEFNSLSKTYNMAGWRLGAVLGNPQVLGYLHTYKTLVDSSTFSPLMSAAAAALQGDQSWVAARNQIYQQRRDVIVKALLQMGFALEVPRAGLYVWAHLPQGFSDSMLFCEQLMEDSGVSITPGDIYGACGKGFIRITLCSPVEVLQEAMQRLAKWLER